MVWSSPYGTIFHTLKFLSYHPRGRFEFVNLAARDEEGLWAVLPGGRAVENGRPVFRSPLGASFGGFVFRRPDLRKMLETARQFHSSLRGAGFEAAYMTLPPSCYYSHGDENIRYLMTAAGYRLYSRDATSVVPLSAFDQSSLHGVLARNLRKADREGLTVRQTRDAGPFYGVLVKNLAAKDAAPTHSLEEVNLLLDAFPGRVVVFEALWEDEVVGGCLVMLCNDRVGLAFYICDDPERRPLAVAESALYAAAVWLKEKGVTYFDLGTVSRGTAMNWGLMQFKSKFGTRTYVREHYKMDLPEAHP
jgi:hypothetical protein